MADNTDQFDMVIVGMGHTGLSCARFLASHGLSFAMTDSRDNPPMLDSIRKEFPGHSLLPGRLDENLLLSTGTILLSPGVSMDEPAIRTAKQAGVEIYGDIELFCRYVHAPVIAVTGSNGKSTVTTLVSEMTRRSGLRTAVGGNLGTPALDLLQEDETEIFILELSSFQLETVLSMNARAAVVLNISEDHLDRYSNLESYSQAKQRIYRGDGDMILNRDDPRVMAMQQPGRRCVTFGLGEPDDGDYGIRNIDNRQWLVHGNEKIIAAGDLQIRGEHNLSNALAAIALVDFLQLPGKDICEVLRSFTGLPHRCQWVADHNAVRWINDSKGTNVGATCAAVKGIARDRNIILIAGGDGKGADFAPLAEIAGKLHAAVLIGRDARLISRVLEKNVPVIHATGLPEAVHVAAQMARPGDTVLLSPACASQDMFSDYRERGEIFTRTVIDLVGNND